MNGRHDAGLHGDAPGASPEVLVIVVNYRTPALVVDCLRSLDCELRALPGARVTVVDNDSGDDSVRVIGAAIEGERWAGWARLLASPRNGGFAAGNNFALRDACTREGRIPQYVWLLNPDTQVRPTALRALVEFMEAHPEVGIAGGMLEEADGVSWPYAFRFPTLLSEVERGFRFGPISRLLSRWIVPRRMPDLAARADWVSGASMIVRGVVFEQIGLMDEGYFLYYEETDFCRQAARAGWECWYVPTSRVMHISGQSTGVTGRQTTRRPMPRYWFDSRRRYFVKNHGWPYAACADLGWLLGHATWRVRRIIQRKPLTDAPNLTRDFLRFSALLNPGRCPGDHGARGG